MQLSFFRISLLLFSIEASKLFLGCTPVHEIEDQTFIIEIEFSLNTELLKAWYPVSIDSSYGGFLSDFTYDWKPDGPQHKMLVTQARQVWTASNAAMFYKDERYHVIAEHGFRFLKDRMWDSRHGGFYMLRDREGNAIPNPQGDIKSAYGNAFAIYALAAYYTMSGDDAALNLAQETFSWLDTHGHDPVYKGYFDALTQDGSWLYLSDPIKRRGYLGWAGWKDQNSSIHLLEAFTELYRVWPDSVLRERLLEMLILIRDTMVTDVGYLTLFFERDWTPVSFRDSSDAIREANTPYDHISFGHDVETAYLMLEASHVIGIQSDTKTLTVAKRMVDHALAKGWDDENGGFYDSGYYFDDSLSIINDAKIWWVQAEGLNALLLMSGLFPEEKKYDEAFKKQWGYIKKYLIDHDYGGWYSEGLDLSPEQRKAPKASVWKVNYHNMRALMNCIQMLNSEHELLKSEFDKQ